MRRALVAGCVLAAMAAAPADAAEWTHWRGDTQHSGASSERLPAKLRRGWRAVLPAGGRPPLLVRGRVLVTTNELYVRARLLAFSARTGRLLWRRKVPGSVNLASSDGRVYAAGEDGQMEALDVRTGRRRWSARVAARSCGRPVADGATLVISCETGPAGGIFALDPRNGRVVWSAAEGLADAAPSIAGADVVVAGNCPRVRAFDRATGVQRWTSTTACSELGALAVVHGSQVFTLAGPDRGVLVDAGDGAQRRVVETDRLPAFVGGLAAWMRLGELRLEDAESGEVRWRTRAGGPLGSSPILAAGRVFVFTTRRPFTLAALDVQTGRLVQRLPIPAPSYPHLQEVAVGARRLVVLSGTTLTAFR